MTARPLEGKRLNKRCKETRSQVYNATMADRCKVSSRPNSLFMAGEKNNDVSTLTILQQLDISYTGTWSERSRYENSLVLQVNDGQLPGPIKDREDFPQAARVLAALQRQKRWVNLFIPKNERERQRPFDEELRSNLEWQSWNWNVNQSQASSSSSTTWCQSGKLHELLQGEWQDQQIVRRVVKTVSL